VATPHVLTAVHSEEILKALSRHVQGDWGTLDAEDLQSNERALRFGGRLFSSYHSSQNVKFWIITECDRSVTTVLLPEDFGLGFCSRGLLKDRVAIPLHDATGALVG
jgi:hypothetical protein